MVGIAVGMHIINSTTVRIDRIDVYGMYNYHWIGEARPDVTFQNQSISASKSLLKWHRVRKPARHCYFEMRFNFHDGTTDEFRMHQKHALVDHDAGFSQKVKNHEILYGRESDNVLVIEVKHTKQQLVEIQAQQLNKEGKMKVSNGEYEQGIAKFDEAIRMSNKQEYKNNKASAEAAYKKAQTEKTAECLYNEGKHLMAQGKFEEAIRKFDEAFTLNKKQVYEDQKTLAVSEKSKLEYKKIVHEGHELMKSNLEEAQSFFERAIITSKTPDFTIIYKQELSAVMLLRAEERINKAWCAESDEEKDRTKEAEQAFNDARTILLEASKLGSNANVSEKLSAVNLKIEGNKLFNQGHDLEGLAMKVKEEATVNKEIDGYEICIQRLKDVQVLYEKAKKKFEEGLKMDMRFESSLEFVTSMLEDVVDEISHIEVTVLRLVIDNLTVQNVDGNQVENETLNENLKDGTLMHEIGTEKYC